jgi:hypothetical protein
VGAPYASDAPSQSMVGSLRSWLEKSRNEPTRSRTHWRQRGPPTVESLHSRPGSRRPNAPSSQRWPPPLRQRRVLRPSAWAGPPRPQPHRQLPQSDRLAGRARPQPHLRRPSEQSAGRVSPPKRRHPPSGPSAGLARQPRHQLQYLRSDRSEGRGRVPSRTPHRHRARPMDAVA